MVYKVGMWLIVWTCVLIFAFLGSFIASAVLNLIFPYHGGCYYGS